MTILVNMKLITQRRDWNTGPAKPNEANCLELSGIGEWPGSSRSSGCPEDGGPGCAFSVGNQA